ncbi:CBS domain-containing protein [Hymenobacter jejuensis]|uniref:CBS domain-containing protein n=1 Tax=Hymenobacter jejuensis TaxID=2502781 RepID=UPI001E534126|nr:CBS domain-containing protein [Hymenobacter jejuensis]
MQRKPKNLFYVEPTFTVYQALEQMVEQNVGALMVMHDGHLLGIFTERDYARKVILRGKASKHTHVEEIMSEHPVVVSPNDSVEECMKLMTSRYIRHLPVLENDTVIGLISIGDIVKYIIDEQKFIIENLEHYISGT